MSYTPVAVVTGNHNFDVPGFQRMLDSIPESVCYLQDLDNFVADLGQFNDRYRTVVFYNFHQLTPVASDRLGASTIDAIDRLSENGQGLLILHHAILAFPKWEVWNRIVGISDRSFGYDPDQVVQTDILAGGGFTGGLRLAALAQAFHIPIAPHGAQYPDLNCHLMAAVPNGLIVSSCPPSENEQIWSALYAPAFQVENGRIAMSERPGLGLQLNPDCVESHKV